MDLATLIAKVRDLIAQFQAGNKLAALALLWTLINEVIKAMSPNTPVMMSTGKAAAMAACDGKTEDELIADLEACCVTHNTTAGAPTGPFLDMILPIALALLRKWLGF